MKLHPTTLLGRLTIILMACLLLPMLALMWFGFSQTYDGVEAEALRPAQWRIGALAALFSALGPVVAVLLARLIVQPIDKLTRAAHDFTHGRAAPPLDTRGTDELGELARAFTAMRIAVTEGERALRASLLRAEIANRSKTEFLANMSHELRTPLNAILGFSEVLSSGVIVPVEPRPKSYCDDIHSAGEHLRAIIDDILDIAKIDAGHAELQRQNVDVAEAVEKCLTIIAERARAQGVALGSDIPADLPPLSADRARLHQILLNLLSNAVKFTPPGGSVSVGAAAAPDGLHLHVSDTGIGIPPEHLDRVTEPFFQSEPATSRSHHGAGLGLTLVKEMVGLHGGSLEIHSHERKGTVVIVTLPWGAEGAAA